MVKKIIESKEKVLERMIARPLTKNNYEILSRFFNFCKGIEVAIILTNDGTMKTWVFIENKPNEIKYFSFGLYGSEMIPYNHLELEVEFIDFLETLSRVTKCCYTLHKQGIPCMVVTPNGVQHLVTV